MRKIIAGAFVSLDGIMQAPGGPNEDRSGGFQHGGWVFPHFDEALGEGVDAMFARPFDLLLGRKTYDIFAAHWPFTGADDPIGSLFGSITKFVATRNPDLKLDWHNSRTLGADVVATLRQMKNEDGPDLLTQGSTDLLQALFKHDLVDEFNLFIVPVVIGTGKRLFEPGAPPMALKLASSKTSPAGVTINRYVRGGELQTGSFAQDKPSAAELERRRNLT